MVLSLVHHRPMLNFNQFNKKKEKKEYEIVKSRSNLPMFVIPLPDSVDITSDEDEPKKEILKNNT